MGKTSICILAISSPSSSHIYLVMGVDDDVNASLGWLVFMRRPPPVTVSTMIQNAVYPLRLEK
jgi:hypothetical protein